MAGQQPNREILAWVADYITASLQPEELDRVTAAVNAEIRAAVPQLNSDEGLLRDLAVSTRESLRTYLPSIATDEFTERDVPAAARDLARSFAHRRLELTSLLKLYRRGQDIVWQTMMDTVAEEVADPSLRMDILAYLWPRVSQRLEVAADVVVATYTLERERLLRGALARRSEMIHAILRGSPPPLDEAERILGHAVRRPQTAFVLWVDDAAGEHDLLGRLENHAGLLASAAGAARALTLPAGPRELWGWIAGDASHLDPAAIVFDAGVRAALGGTEAGVPGFRASHREALLAQHVAVAGRSDRALTRYADIELVSLLSNDVDVMRAFVTRELGPLTARDPGTVRLRETTQAYLAAGGNARLAAETIGTHKNTVIYRVNRSEELLGRPIGERRLQLELALMLFEAFGSEALEAE